MQYEDLDGQVNILRRLVKSSFMRSLAVHLSHGKCVIKPNIHTPHSYLKLDVKITRPIDRIFNQDFPRATKLTGNKSCLFVYTAAIFGKRHFSMSPLSVTPSPLPFPVSRSVVMTTVAKERGGDLRSESWTMYLVAVIFNSSPPQSEQDCWHTLQSLDWEISKYYQKLTSK